MNTPLVTTLQDLLKRGAKLIPDGGSEFSGYNAKRQSKYLLWRKNCLDAIGQLREKGTVLYSRIANDENGMYFYQSSAQKISSVVEDALEIARLMQEEAVAVAKAEEEQAAEAVAAAKAEEEQAAEAVAAAKAEEEQAAEAVAAAKAVHRKPSPDPVITTRQPVLETLQRPELSLAERLDENLNAAHDRIPSQEPIAALEVISEAAAEPLVIDVPGADSEVNNGGAQIPTLDGVTEPEPIAEFEVLAEPSQIGNPGVLDDADQQDERSHPDRWKTIEPPILMPDTYDAAPAPGKDDASAPVDEAPAPGEDDAPAPVDDAPAPVEEDAPAPIEDAAVAHDALPQPRASSAETTPVLVFSSSDHPLMPALQAMFRERSVDCTLVAHTSGIWNSLPALDAMRPLPRYGTFLLSPDHCQEELMALGYVAGRYPWLTLSCLHHASQRVSALLPGVSRFTFTTSPVELRTELMNELKTAGYSVSL